MADMKPCAGGWKPDKRHSVNNAPYRMDAGESVAFVPGGHAKPIANETTLYFENLTLSGPVVIGASVPEKPRESGAGHRPRRDRRR